MTDYLSIPGQASVGLYLQTPPVMVIYGEHTLIYFLINVLNRILVSEF